MTAALDLSPRNETGDQVACAFTRKIFRYPIRSSESVPEPALDMPALHNRGNRVNHFYRLVWSQPNAQAIAAHGELI